MWPIRGISKGRIGLSLVFVLLLPILSGCWDSVDIDNRATVLGLSIDKAEEDAEEEETEITHLQGTFQAPEEDLIRVSAQIAVPGRIPLGPRAGGGGGDKEPVWVVSVVGRTIEDAMMGLQQEVSDEITLGHLRVIVISEEVAREGVKRYNDYFRRNPEIRRAASLVISDGSARKFMEVAPELERIPSLYLAAMVENATDLGKFPTHFIGLFWRILSSKGQDPYLPYLKIKEADNIQINGLAYFKGDKMVGITKPLQIGFYMAVIGEGQGGYSGFVNVPETEHKVVVRAVSRKSSIKTSLKDGKPHVDIKIRYETEIDEKDESKLKLDNNDIIQKIEKETSKSSEKSVQTLIQQTQEDESDIFGFGEYFRAKHSNYWNREIQTREKWHEAYKELEVTVEVVTHIRRVGMKAE
jgi:spore germination protein KC